MKGIEAIVAHIEADSRQECGALLQAAQRQAEELREHGRQKQARFADGNTSAWRSIWRRSNRAGGSF